MIEKTIVNTCEILKKRGSLSNDSAHSEWHKYQNLPTGVTDVPAVSYGRSFFIFGGYGKHPEDIKKDVWEFNQGGWHPKSPMINERWGAAATVFRDCAYVFGGYPNNVAELYQIKLDKWKPLNPMPDLL